MIVDTVADPRRGQSGHGIHCGQLILRRITRLKLVPPWRCQMLRLKMQLIRFLMGLRSSPRWGSLQRFPDSLAVFKGLLLRDGGEREGKGRGGKGKWMEREGECRGGKGRGGLPPNWGVWICQ